MSSICSLGVQQRPAQESIVRWNMCFFLSDAFCCSLVFQQRPSQESKIHWNIPWLGRNRRALGRATRYERIWLLVLPGECWFSQFWRSVWRYDCSALIKTVQAIMQQLTIMERSVQLIIVQGRVCHWMFHVQSESECDVFLEIVRVSCLEKQH